MAACVQRTILPVLAQLPQAHIAYLFGSAVRNRLTSTSDIEAAVQELTALSLECTVQIGVDIAAAGPGGRY